MNNQSNDPIDKLYRNLPEKEREEALENMERYVQLSWKIYQRIKSDPVEYVKFGSWVKEQRRQRRKRQP